VEKIVDCVEEDVISGHALKDIMKTNYSMEAIQKALKDK